MKVFVVIHEDWDTEGHSSPASVVGVFTNRDLIPERYQEQYLYQSYSIHEVEVDKVEQW